MNDEEKVCGVCYANMKDLANEQKKLNGPHGESDKGKPADLVEEGIVQEESMNNDSDGLWSDIDSELSLDTRIAIRAVYEKQIPVGSECLECYSVMCNECMADWALATI